MTATKARTCPKCRTKWLLDPLLLRLHSTPEVIHGRGKSVEGATVSVEYEYTFGSFDLTTNIACPRCERNLRVRI